ncbi:MAG: hemerythrin domain-containing protein [Fusobacterium sp. JB021]|nr:hemerythrin domain-containing protein [Fusobacterium sp. JB021]MDP0506152.1 hemerythrin domain-containing protein [Fusobacterium sp. JB019]
MYGIDLLVEEHNNILRMKNAIRKICIKILEGDNLNIDKFEKIIDFGKNYADKHHHQKEEKILFKVMIEKLGPVANTLIKNGMLVEHDLGRLHMMQLVDATNKYKKNPKTEYKMDIIFNALAYGDLLQRHIDKENIAAYNYADRVLCKEDKIFINKETEILENEASKNKFQKKYLKILEEIEK